MKDECVCYPFDDDVGNLDREVVAYQAINVYGCTVLGLA